ncbi:MAG: monovalent cation/H(+) antiporter subunit G [Anaerolineae bacterium]|nr:monovalent cation/H(+) antiporter subunit G [Anaerolineae bacterium]
MQDVINILGVALLWVGIVFSALGVLGLYRLPDVYCRLHASGKISTMGLFGILVGAALLMPATALKVLALAVFVIITSPVSTHAIAMAAYRSGVPQRRAVRDDLGGHFVPLGVEQE